MQWLAAVRRNEEIEENEKKYETSGNGEERNESSAEINDISGLKLYSIQPAEAMKKYEEAVKICLRREEKCQKFSESG